jgi:hypothetical protein
MKQAILCASLLALYLPAAQAVDFNNDALKSMQKEGHKIVEAEQKSRAYALASGLCLQASGSALAASKCNSKSNNQKWYFDDQKRLVSHSGDCVNATAAGAAAALQKCGSGKSQQWKHDGKQRLANGNKLCLQAGSDKKVVAAACGNSPDQVWK